MIVNTMIGKSGGGGDVTVQATELTIDDSNIVHIKFPGLPAGATIKNLNVLSVEGECTVNTATYNVCSLAGKLSTSENWYYRYRALGASGLSATARSTITVGDGEITFSMPSGMTAISLDTSGSIVVYLTYST